ncbi:MAG: TIGR01777 family oxidoreductase [Myxococcales bacterium]
MKIVVGGASGLIGKRLVARLAARGDEVVALVRTTAGDPPWARGVRRVAWDGKQSGPWAAELDGAGAVVNLAGASVSGKRWSESYKQEILASRVDSTRALVQAMGAAAQKPRVFVSGSAVGYYGGRGDEPLDESAAPGDGFLAGVVRAWEAEAVAAEALGVRVALLRTGVVLAVEGGALPQMLPPFKAFVWVPVGSGKQWFPWIHVDDEVSLLVWAIDRDLRGPVNAAAPGVETMEAFCKSLGRVLHRPSWAKVPAAALRLAVGEFATVLTEGQRVVPGKAAQSGFRFRFERSEAALADLLARA